MRFEFEGSPEELETLRCLLCTKPCPQEVPGPAVSLSIVPAFPLPAGVKIMLTLPNDKTSALSIVAKDARGKNTKLDSVPSWTSSDANILTVTAAEDGMSAVVAAGALDGIEGNANGQITVTADVREGPDVVEKSGVLDVEVRPGEAVSLEISAGPLQ